jgi:hypothetical protein
VEERDTPVTSKNAPIMNGANCHEQIALGGEF